MVNAQNSKYQKACMADADAHTSSIVNKVRMHLEVLSSLIALLRLLRQLPKEGLGTEMRSHAAVTLG